MPQGPGTYGKNKGRPRKRHKTSLGDLMNPSMPQGATSPEPAMLQGATSPNPQEEFDRIREAQGMPPSDVNDPRHKYDNKALIGSGFRAEDVGPDKHLPSEFKSADHPNRFVDGVDTITGQPAPLPPENQATKKDALRSLIEHSQRIPDPESQGAVRWGDSVDTPGGYGGWSMNQEDADAREKMFGGLANDAKIAFGDGSGESIEQEKIKKEEEIAAEVEQATSLEGRHKTNRRLEAEGKLPPGFSDKAQDTQAEYDRVFDEKGNPRVDVDDQPTIYDKDSDWTSEGVQGRMRDEERRNIRRDTGLDTWEDNQQYKREQSTIDPEHMEKVKKQVEEDRWKTELEERDEYENSGFNGTQSEWKEDKTLKERYQRGLDDLSVHKDTDFDTWKAQDYDRRFTKAEEKRTQRQEDNRGVHRSRDEAHRRRQDKDLSRSQEIERMGSARRAGLKQGTPEWAAFMGQEGTREHELAIEYARNQDTKVAQEQTKQVKTETEGRINIQDMLGDQRISELKQLNVNEEALQGLINDGIDLTNKSNQEIQKLIEEGATGRTKLAEEGATGRTEMTEEGATGRTKLTEEGATGRTKLTEEGATGRTKDSLAAAEKISARGDVTANEQMKIMKGLEEGKIDLAAFQIEMDAMLKADNATADRMAEFLTAGAQMMTPEMMELGLARLAQMDGGAAFVDQVKGFQSDTSLGGLDDAEIAQKKADDAAATEKAKLTSTSIVAEFPTQEEAEKWDTNIRSVTQEDSGAIAILNDLPSWGGGSEFEGRAKTALTELEEVRYQMASMTDKEAAKKMARDLLKRSKISELGDMDMFSRMDKTKVIIKTAARGLLESIQSIARGDLTPSSKYNDAMGKLGLNLP